MAEPKFNKLFVILPLIIILALGAIFALRLTSDKDESLPSTLIGKAAPTMQLPMLEGLLDDNGNQIGAFDSADLKDKISIVNIFASWCTPCRAEHPILMDIAKNYPELQMIGINTRDKTDNALKFLDTLGNPYDAVGVDANGRAIVEWGGYGVPETFIVDQSGQIRFKFVGPISPAIFEEQFLPIIESLQG